LDDYNDSLYFIIFDFVLGDEKSVGFKTAPIWLWLISTEFELVMMLLKDKYISHQLFNVTNNSSFFYDAKADFLSIQGFRHSLFLEYVFGTFPTVIIVLILLPSLYLLYSLDENSEPILTVKAIGHQWYWSYEVSRYFKSTANQFFFRAIV